MRQVKRLLPYVRRYVQMAVYDVLERRGRNTGRMKAARWSPGFRFTERQHLQPFGGDMRHGNRTDGFRT